MSNLETVTVLWQGSHRCHYIYISTALKEHLCTTRYDVLVSGNKVRVQRGTAFVLESDRLRLPKTAKLPRVLRSTRVPITINKRIVEFTWPGNI